MYSPLRHIPSLLYKQRAIQLTFFVTRRCNASCPFCFYLKNNNTLQSQENTIGKNDTTENELQLDEIEKVSASMGKLLWLAFSGGEIFLRRDLAEISRIFYRKNKPVYMLFPTNGMMPERIKHTMEDILKHCKHSVVIVKLSIDDLYEKHNQLRNTANSFEKTLRTYHLLAPLLNQYPNFELGVNSVFCAQNQDHIEDIINFVNNMKYINTHTLSLVRGNLNDDSYKKVDMKKYWHYTQLLANKIRQMQSPIYRFRGSKLKIAQDIYQRKLIHKTYTEQRRLIPCFAGKSNLVLTETGEVYPCETLNESFGNVRQCNYRLDKLQSTPMAKNLLNKIENACCYCTHECYFITNIMLNPMLYPAVLKEYIKIKTS